MTATTEILEIGASTSAGDKQTQSEYAAEAVRTTGYTSGIVSRKPWNKIMRQLGLMCSGLGQFLADNQNTNVVDTLTPANISTMLTSAVTSLATTTIIGNGGYPSLPVFKNSSASPNTVLDIPRMRVSDSAGVIDLALLTAMSKTLQASGTWAAGTGQNGLFTGARANSTCYHVFLIRKTSDGSIDCGFDTSITAADKPGGYGEYTHVFSIITDTSGNILQFLQVGKHVRWVSPVLVASTTTLGTTRLNFSLASHVPINLRIEFTAFFYRKSNVNGVNIYVTSPDQTDLVPTADATYPSTSANPANLANVTGVTDQGSGGMLIMICDTSAQIAARSSHGNTEFHVWVYGWNIAMW